MIFDWTSSNFDVLVALEVKSEDQPPGEQECPYNANPSKSCRNMPNQHIVKMLKTPDHNKAINSDNVVEIVLFYASKSLKKRVRKL